MKNLAKLAMVIILAMALVLPAGVSAQVEDWSVPLAITSAIGSVDVTFGAHTDASDGFDDDYDIPAPMPPMEGVEAYFYYPDNPQYKRMLTTSIVAPADSIIWPLKVQYITEGEAGEVTISWEFSDINNVPSKYITLELEDKDGNKLADMRSVNHYTFSASQGQTYNFQIRAEVPKYDLTIDSTDGGEVTTPGEGVFNYDEGTWVNLVASPGVGYYFVNWTGDVDTIANVNVATTTITMNGHYSITANFELERTLIISSTAGGSVTTPGEGTFTYDAGEVVNLVASPSAGYQFDNWSGQVATIANVNAASTTITMSVNYSITANFAAIPPPQYNLTISSTVGGAVTVPGEGGFIRDEGAVVSLVATPASGYHFVNWTGDVSTIENVNAATTTITMNGHYSITANFEEIPVTYYTLTMALNGSGSTSPSVGQHTYVAGTVIPISATPTIGYRFVNWTGDVGTIENVNAATTTITMNGHYSITANFVRLYDLTISSTTGGSVTTPGEGAFTYDEGTVVNLVASPGVGYYFVNWTGDVDTIANVNASNTTITMQGDYEITANFELEPVAFNCTLTISSTAGGSVTTPGEGIFYCGSGTVVNLVASPGVGYYFVNWTGDVDTIANVNAANTTITMQGDYEITAQFLAGVVAAKTETVTGGGTVDATEEADTEVAVNGTATVTVARYEDNPGGPAPTGFSSLDKYIDVYVPDTTEVTKLEIRLYYTDAELAAADIDEESLLLFWWDGDDWVACSDSGVNTASTNGYSGYMWAKIRNDTTPSLADLQGTEFGGYGHPSETPQPCGCFIATAAYGTDTAKEIDILREFRDTVLLPNSLGAKFVCLYYKTSPPIANFVSRHEVLRTAVRVGFVDLIVKILNWTPDLWSARG